MSDDRLYRVTERREGSMLMDVIRSEVFDCLAEAEARGCVAVESGYIMREITDFCDNGILFVVLHVMQAAGEVDVVWSLRSDDGFRIALVAYPETFAAHAIGTVISSKVVRHS